MSTGCGKGDKPRPMSISRDEWEKNYRRIFGPKPTRKKKAP